ncbi:hypothetical protein Tco_0860413 [Tanacetum coccineum]|uniref:Uncharacterized protein n=1 Tax=Tanacetum coccineum TaxID=301880 RepID=A0ABQ5BEU5_9ASTR
MLIKKSTDGTDSFIEMKNRFLSFKKEKENLDCYKELAEAQSPKNGPCDTNVALEFSVNALQVRILSDVIVIIPISIPLFVNSNEIRLFLEESLF